MRERLLDTTSKNKQKKSQQAPKLIKSDDESKGKLTLHVLRRLQLTGRLKQLLETAGLKWDVARFLHGSLCLGLVVFALVWYFAPRPFDVAALALGPLAAILPFLYVVRTARTRLRKFEEQFPESLEFVARSMRAGHAFSVSLEMLHREFREPLAGEFRQTFDEQNLGLPLEIALGKLAKRIPSIDVHFFVSAVLLQKRTGGNLAEILDKLAHLIRERFKLRGRIRAISAHGRMTGTALSLIPVGVAVIMFYVNPDYVTFFFTDSTGQWMLGGAVGFQILGYAVIKKIVSIEV
jgi:tight adherence protein B